MAEVQVESITPAKADVTSDTAPVEAPDTTASAAAVVPEESSNNGTGQDDSKTEPKEDPKDEKTSTAPQKRKHERNGGREASSKKWSTYKSNVKTDYSKLPESSDPDEIRKQVEFYFSDSNLSYDDHMYELAGEDKSVPVNVIHSFKRMLRFQPYSAVVAALKDSKLVDIIGKDEDEIKRKVPYKRPENTDEFHDPSIPRSVYAKGFGQEGSTTQLDIEALFTPYGPINMVRLRRSYPERHFKGSIFVEFESEDLQKQFLDLENKPKWNGNDLLIMSKQEYCDNKLKDIKAGKINPRQANQYKQYVPKKQFQERYNGNRSNRRDNGRDRDRDRGRSNRDKDDWKGRRDDFQKNRSKESDDKVEVDQSGIPVVQSSTAEDTATKKRARDQDEDPEVEEETVPKKAKAEDEADKAETIAT